MKESYCICGQLVASDIERNEHILSHFAAKHCVTCDNLLIFVAGKWYQPHIDSNCITIKEELAVDFDFIGLSVKNVDGTHEEETSNIELVVMPLPKEEFLEEIEENNELENEEHFSNLIDTEVADKSSDLQSKLGSSSNSTNKKNVFQCQKCFRVYAHYSTLFKHKKVCKGFPEDPKPPIPSTSSRDPKKKFECKKCFKVYAHQPSLFRHNKICNGVPEAPKKLSPLENFTQQTFECKKCFKIYAHYESLYRHEKNCQGIDKNSTNNIESNEVVSLVETSDSVVLNLSGNCIDQSLEQSQCSLSQSDFTDEKISESQTSTNVEDNPPKIRPFRCLICSARFIRRGDVKNHMYVHNKTRSKSVRLYDAAKTSYKKDETGRYKCPYCPKTFVHKPSVNSHKRKAHRDRLSYGSLKCQLCPATYQNRKSLRCHVLQKHTDRGPQHIIERIEKVEEIEEIEKIEEIEEIKKREKKEKKPSDVSEINELIEYVQEEREGDEQQIIGNRSGLPNRTVSCQNNSHESHTKTNNSSESVINILTEKKPFRCIICSGRFMRIGDAQRHVRNVHKNPRKQRLFEAKKQPMLLDELGRYQCPYCPKTFVHISSAYAHRRTNHTDRLVTGSIKCKLCPATFQKSASLHTHMSREHRGNEIRFSCYVCQTSFRYPKMLITHMQTHPNIEYKCSFSKCAQRFNSDKMLRQHLNKHMETQCDLCHKTYKRTFLHKCDHPDSKKFICDICGKIFVNKFSLKYHINMHTDSRPYPCKVCNKSFRSNTALYRHRQIHSGNKRQKCNVEHCDRAFIQHVDLYRHQFKAHGIFRKKFPCTICNEIFPENALLRKHLLNHEA